MSRITAAVIGALFLSPFAAPAEDTQAVQEIHELKLLIEQQMKRIDELTVEVGRLHQSLETNRAALAPGPAPKREVGAFPAYSGQTEILKPATSKPEPPKAERAKPVAEEIAKPEASTGVKHLVEKGETLTSIAKRYNIGLPDLLKANKTVNDRKLQIGQTLSIPISASPETANPPEPSAPSEKKENL